MHEQGVKPPSFVPNYDMIYKDAIPPGSHADSPKVAKA
jgi:hypothetical protein